ncbi:MAG: hypothetical protein H6722_20015 [Sandaracinus sp.]|nr:hypothetical protein [Sandaracinus sp.]
MKRTAVLLLALAACGDDDGPMVTDDGGTDAAMDDAGTDAGPACGVPGEPPRTRGEHMTILDAARDRLVVFGGNVAVPIMCNPATEIVDELWTYDLGCESWSRVEGAAGPGFRSRGGFVVDTMRDRALLFGGRDRRTSSGAYTNFDDLWALDLETLSWSQITATGAAPSARSNPAVAYDAARDRMIVYGGNTSTSGLSPTGADDTFALDLATNTWSEIAGDGPSPRYAHAYAQTATRFYVFGGTASFDGFLNDAWFFDFASDTWTRIVPSGTPPTLRFGAVLFVNEDVAGDRLVVATGHDLTAIGNLNDMWQLDVATGAWTELRTGDTHNGAARVCDLPADFTTQDLDAPERRELSAWVQTATHGYVVGGKTDCGNVNDVWRVDLATPGWELIGLATTSGESCARGGNAGCTAYCF